MARIRIGVSGWDYDQWQGDFYPERLARAHRLTHVGERFDTVEVNSTFYSLATRRAVDRWYHSVPAGFVFAVKGSRYITHRKKLAGVETALANFFASGLLGLGDKLGPILWQLPEQLHFDAERIDRFLGLLPRKTDQARALARHHDDRISDVAWGPHDRHRLRHVLEVRHASWLCPELVTIARRHRVAIASSHAASWPYTEEVTAGFVYLRLHGPGRLYASPYGADGLRRWSDRIRAWHEGREPADARRITDRSPPARKGRDVYVYFDNDAGGYAPHEALALRDLLGADDLAPRQP
ncbi:MAG: DUF72 domain-containing protein [Acidimicrobiia bacterium]|nr:DUF72 domain-containing protein [Acidimicrobiia bacterium]